MHDQRGRHERRARGADVDVAVRLQRFRCWWCRRDLGAKRLHHEVTSGSTTRRCCFQCYLSQDSNYRRVYESEDDERQEIQRVRNLIGKWACGPCQIFLTNQEVFGGAVEDIELVCPKCRGELRVHGKP